MNDLCEAWWSDGWGYELDGEVLDEPAVGARAMTGLLPPEEAIRQACLRAGSFTLDHGPGDVYFLDAKGRRVNPYKAAVRAAAPSPELALVG